MPAERRRASPPSLPEQACPSASRVVAGIGERPSAGTADHVDDHGREQNRDDEAAAVPMEEQRPGDPRGERAGDTDEHRLEDAHRVAARQREPGERADDQTDKAEVDDVADQGGLLKGWVPAADTRDRTDKSAPPASAGWGASSGSRQTSSPLLHCAASRRADDRRPRVEETER